VVITQKNEEVSPKWLKTALNAMFRQLVRVKKDKNNKIIKNREK